MDMKKTFIKYFIYLGAFAAVLFAGNASGAEISLTGSVDKTDIAFEDSLTLTVEIKWFGDITSYTFQVLPLPDAENLKVTGTSSSISSKSSEDGDITLRTFKYVLRPTGPGTGTIEPVVLDYVALPDSTAGQLATQRFQISIAPPIPRGTEANLPFFARVLIFIAAIIITVVIIIMIRRKKKVHVEPEKTPEDEFLDGLETARKETQNDRKQFFTRLHKLLIVFLERKYDLELSGKTTQLVVEQLETVDMPVVMKENISNWLTQADREKFAPGAGSPGDVLRLATEIDKTFRK